MKVNTVTLELSKYNNFLEYKKIVEKSKFVCFQQWNGEVRSLKESEVIDILKQENEHLKNQVDDLKNYNKDEKTIEDIKQMNLLSLIKWKITKG